MIRERGLLARKRARKADGERVRSRLRENNGWGEVLVPEIRIRIAVKDISVSILVNCCRDARGLS
jgi:hypothetical protein